MKCSEGRGYGSPAMLVESVPQFLKDAVASFKSSAFSSALHWPFTRPGRSTWTNKKNHSGTGALVSGSR